MEPQVLKTAAGEELVVLPRRDYDVLLARLGDEEAEDRLLLAMVDELSEVLRLEFPRFKLFGFSGGGHCLSRCL